MTLWLLLVLVIGINFVLWGSVGFLRLCDERIARWRSQTRRGHHRGGKVPGHPLPVRSLSPVSDVPAGRLTTADVAVLMAAHNEELVIDHSLRAIAELVPIRNVHVVSDFSTDRTVELARKAGANVIETRTNVGKAGALEEGITHFRLSERFEVVLIVDADTELDHRYFEVALPLLDDPRVVAVACCTQTRWQPSELSTIGAMIVAHRQRVYTLMQRLLKYGQTWRGLSATHIIPGCASMYRSRVLEQIDVNPGGLVIEDFNMTFEVCTKRLGQVAFSLQACAYTQDPNRYRDYVRQMKRWALGLWQTLRRHRPRRGVFGAMLVVLISELITSSLFLLLVPLTLFVWGAAALSSVAGLDLGAHVADTIDDHVNLTLIVLGILLPDYLLTCFVALLDKRPRYLYLGLFFMAMRVTDAFVALYMLPRAWLERSNGQWQSPPRRAIAPGEPGRDVA
ncbi:glycosyltransferase family 2 protein [Geodermatophilus sp. SYSU D00708]